MKLTFSKPALTYAEQLVRLEERGMAVTDRAEAEFYLAHLNYANMGFPHAWAELPLWNSAPRLE